ncbi:MAG: TolC family protein [Vicinamibacterales bacterium]
MVPLVLVLALLTAAEAAAQPPASSPVLTLAQAVERARRESPLRAGAAAIAEGSASAAALAGRLMNPVIELRGENFAPGNTNPLLPPPDVFAQVSQPIELAGKRGLRRDIAGADRDASSLVLAAIERQIALDTVRAYMRAVRAREVLANLATQRDGLGTMVTTMRRRVDEGFAAESDLLRFEAEAARMAAEMARMEIEQTRALAELSALLGSTTPIAPSMLALPPALEPPAVTDDALGAAVDQRPDIRLATARVDRARLASTLEDRRRLPDPILTGGYKRTMGQNTAVAGVLLAVPLFDQNGQTRALASAAARAAELDREAARARALTEAKAAIAAAKALTDSLVRVRRDLLVPAEGVRNAAQAMFREGATDVLKLVDAERIYADVRREALALAIDAYVAAIEARFAVAQEEIP